MSPDVSIIIPVYNAEAYLPRCIDSVQNQTLHNWELLLVNDGSTDKSGAICDAYAARDSRIRVIHQENAGVSAARNAGLAAASGQYIGFVDADDWVDSEMFQSLCCLALGEACDIAMCDAVTVYSDEHTEPDTITQLDHDCVLMRDQISPSLLLELAGAVWRCLYRADLIRANDVVFPQKIKFSEDRIFNLLSFGRANGIAYQKKAYYNRFVNTESAVHRFHADYFEAYLAAAAEIKKAIDLAWDQDEDYQIAYLKQLIGGAFSAVNNYYYRTSPLSGRERRAAVRKLCQNPTLRKAIELTGASDIRSKLIQRQNVWMLILYAKLANWKHGR